MPTRVTVFRLSGTEYPACLECISLLPRLRRLHDRNIAHFLGLGCRGSGSNLVSLNNHPLLTSPLTLDRTCFWRTTWTTSPTPCRKHCTAVLQAPLQCRPQAPGTSWRCVLGLHVGWSTSTKMMYVAPLTPIPDAAPLHPHVSSHPAAGPREADTLQCPSRP